MLIAEAWDELRAFAEKTSIPVAWTLLGIGSPGPIVAMSALSAIALLVSGTFYFRRMERTFADVV